MERQKAIEEYSKIKLTELTENERAEQLEVMTLEDWTDIEEWNHLPKSIQKEFMNGRKIQNPKSEKYDDVLIIWLKYELQSVSNKFLCRKLNIENIKGNPIDMNACPCCGHKSIGQRGDYDICKVCWWEDSGADNENADRISGPNHISLVLGRYNYLVHGLFDPKRTDLMKLKAEDGKYELSRVFQIIDNKLLIEKGTEWKWEINVA